MTFEEMLDQALAMLQRRGWVTYGMLNRQFQLDEEALADLKEAVLYTYPEGRAELCAAIELYRGMDMTFWLLQAEARLAQVAGQ